MSRSVVKSMYRVWVQLLVMACVTFAAAPVITSTPITSATEDVEYTYMPVATGGSGALTWSVKSGASLPSWLSLITTGSPTMNDFKTNLPSRPMGVGYNEATGDLYFTGTDKTIYKINSSGVLSTYGDITTGTQYGSMIVDGNNLYVPVDGTSNSLLKFDLTNTSGTATGTVFSTTKPGLLGLQCPVIRSLEVIILPKDCTTLIK